MDACAGGRLRQWRLRVLRCPATHRKLPLHACRRRSPFVSRHAFGIQSEAVSYERAVVKSTQPLSLALHLRFGSRAANSTRDATRRARILRPVARVAAKLVHRIRPRVSISRCFSPRQSDQRLRIPAIPAISAVRSSPIIARNVSPFCFMLSESQ